MSEHLDTAKAEMAKQNPDVVVREDSQSRGKELPGPGLVYSFKNQDLLFRPFFGPDGKRKPTLNCYYPLMDFPKYGVYCVDRPGLAETPPRWDVVFTGNLRHLSEPLDESCACTARDFAATL